MTVPGARRAPSIRTLSIASIALFGIVAVLIVGVLAWSSDQVQASMETVMRDTQSRALVSELELSLLVYQRVSNAYALTPEDELAQARRELLAEIRRLLASAEALAGSANERRLLADVAARLTDYLNERERLEAEGLEMEALFRLSQPAVNATVASLEALRELNDAEIREGYERSQQVIRIATLLAALVGGLLVLGLLATAHSLRRYVVRPMLALHETILRLRSGDAGARAERDGSSEVQDLADGLNQMADALEQQREDQLTFLAGIAHDLRNPLYGLKLGIQALAVEPSPAERQRTHSGLIRQVDRLTRMVEDLLDATRIEAGQLEIRAEVFDLRDIVDEMVKLYAPTSPSHPITLSAPPDDAVLVHADPLRIAQVVSNLISNAIKYSPAGGPVAIEVRRNARDAVLSVTDTGTGIEAEDLGDIFLPFRRRRTEEIPGAGLGLSVVRRIIAAHSGTIGVTSSLGRGSTFRVALPLYSESAEALPAEQQGSG